MSDAHRRLENSLSAIEQAVHRLNTRQASSEDHVQLRQAATRLADLSQEALLECIGYAVQIGIEKSLNKELRAWGFKDWSLSKGVTNRGSEIAFELDTPSGVKKFKVRATKG